MEDLHSRFTRQIQIRFVSVPFCIIALSGTVYGDVHDYGGNIYAGVQTSPPPGSDLRLNRLEDNTRVRAYLESYKVPITPFTLYDAKDVGRYDSNRSLRPGYIPINPGDRANSYIFHFDPTSGIPAKSARGWVEFTSPIYVISRNASLDNTDDDYGFASGRYSKGALSDRGFDLLPQDWFDISNPRTGIWRLEFFVQASTGQDQLRVIEVVPAPSSLALLGLGGLLSVRRRRAALNQSSR